MLRILFARVSFHNRTASVSSYFIMETFTFLFKDRQQHFTALELTQSISSIVTQCFSP